MPKRLTEITATWQHEKQRWESADGDTLIGDVSLEGEQAKPSRISIKVREEASEPSRHLTYRFYGTWSNYTNKYTGKSEKQFHAKTFVRCEPHGRAGIISYLIKAPGIGRVFAGRLHEKFSSNAVKILREQPDVAAAAVPNLSADVAELAAEYLEREKGLEDCTIELVDLLAGRGFPQSVCKEATKEFGNRAAQLIKSNPYLLMRFRGCGFKLADALYLDLEHNPAALKRQALCAWHVIAQRTSGDTWHYVDVVHRGLDGSIGGTEVRSAKALRLAIRGRILARTYTNGLDGEPSWDGDTSWVADERKAASENRLAREIGDMMAEPNNWPDLQEIVNSISAHQAEKLELALTGPLAILGGSPGTGKTFTAAALIGQLVRIYGADQIGIAAPTGKAAVRLSEALNDYHIPLRAKTWHSLLGVEKADAGGWSFKHNASDPLPFKVLIGDESSMIDTSLAASIFAARARGTLVLLIGDINQLPPVGHGAPLRDMIAAGVPYGELREIRRNSGAIVEACANIRDGSNFDCTGNLVSMAGGADAMLRGIEEHSRELDLNPVWDCQVLCAVNKKSALSRSDLNKLLQNHLNPNPRTSGPFRLQDKIVNTKNGWFPPTKDFEINPEEVQTNADGKIYVANGELGRVVRVEPKFLEVRLSSPTRKIVVPRGADSESDGTDGDATGTGCNWDLGYALSVHKSQGSEWPAVFVMVDDSPSAARVCSREWLYTAISRAKQVCYLVGQQGVAQGFIRRTSLDKRKTFLKEQIIERLPSEQPLPFATV